MQKEEIDALVKDSKRLLAFEADGRLSIACCDMSALAVDTIRQNGGMVDFLDNHRYAIHLPKNTVIVIQKNKTIILIDKKHVLELVFSAYGNAFIASLPIKEEEIDPNDEQKQKQEQEDKTKKPAIVEWLKRIK